MAFLGVIPVIGFVLLIVFSVRDMATTWRRWKHLQTTYPVGQRQLPAKRHRLLNVYLGGWRHPFQHVLFGWEPEGIFWVPVGGAGVLGFRPFYIPTGEYEIGIDQALLGKSVTVTPKGEGCSPISMSLSVWRKSGAAG